MKAKLALLFVCFLGRLNAQLLLQINKDSTHTWHYQSGDEFDAPEINTGFWAYHLGWARSIYPNKEQQYYSDGENHLLQNGSLLLFAEKREVNKRLVDWMGEQDSIRAGNTNYGLNQRNFSYTSGMLQSLTDFTCGYFEIKFRMPNTAGFWPAFWLYGCTPNEEIDMMELKTEYTNRLHIGRYSQNPKENFTKKGPFKRAWGEWIRINGNLNESYHVVAGEWTGSHLKFYLNGELLAYSPISMKCPKKLVVNLAVPANDGPFKPGPADTVRYSGNFEVDYIRIWTTSATAATTPQLKSDTLKTIGVTRMRNTGRATYGPKSLHRNEGITLSLFPAEDGYELCLLGKNIPEGTWNLMDHKGSSILSGELRYGRRSFALPHHETFTLQVDVFGRRHSLVLYQGRITQQ